MRSIYIRFILIPLVLLGCASPKPEVHVVQNHLPSFDIQAERGARNLAPENSIAAFRKAIELGVPTLELDLQTTRDHVLIVEHDTKLDHRRCAYDDGKPLPQGYFRELDFDSLATIDCSKKKHFLFFGKNSKEKTRISRLEEVVALAGMAMYPVRLSIEIKWVDPFETAPVEETAELLVKVLKQAKFDKRVTVVSYEPKALLAVHHLAPYIPLSILADRRSEFDPKLRISQASILSPDYRALSIKDIARYQARGIKVIPFNVNEPQDIRRVMSWGVDGIITSRPDVALKIARR